MAFQDFWALRTGLHPCYFNLQALTLLASMPDSKQESRLKTIVTNCNSSLLISHLKQQHDAAKCLTESARNSFWRTVVMILWYAYLVFRVCDFGMKLMRSEMRNWETELVFHSLPFFSLSVPIYIFSKPVAKGMREWVQLLFFYIFFVLVFTTNSHILDYLQDNFLDQRDGTFFLHIMVEEDKLCFKNITIISRRSPITLEHVLMSPGKKSMAS